MNDTRLSMARLALEQLSRKDRVALLRELGITGEQQPAQSPETRILRRQEVARRLSVSLRTVDLWAKTGLIKKKLLPGHVRASGFSSAEVERLILHEEQRK